MCIFSLQNSKFSYATEHFPLATPTRGPARGPPWTPCASVLSSLIAARVSHVENLPRHVILGALNFILSQGPGKDKCGAESTSSVFGVVGSIVQLENVSEVIRSLIIMRIVNIQQDLVLDSVLNWQPMKGTQKVWRTLVLTAWHAKAKGPLQNSTGGWPPGIAGSGRLL